MPKITLRLTAAEQMKFTKLAQKAGLSLSNYLRGKLGLGRLNHGGERPRTDLYCGPCWRADRGQVDVYAEGLCEKCHDEIGTVRAGGV